MAIKFQMIFTSIKEFYQIISKKIVPGAPNDTQHQNNTPEKPVL